MLFATSLSAAAEDRVRIVLDQFGGVGAQRTDPAPYPRLSAEFESTRVLLLGMADWQPHHRHIFVEIAQKTAGHVNLMVLCNDTWQIKMATEWLLEKKGDYPHVYFCEMVTDTVWLRDFAPIFAQTEKGTQAIDFFYEGSRPKDDALPKQWAKRSRAEYVRAPWTMQGGNLISNGRGVAITTNRIFEDNHIRFPNDTVIKNVEQERRVMVIKAVMQHCNLAQLVVLEPLQNEQTKHVDMFATFLSPNDVMVAQVDPRQDRANTIILERNVTRLKRVKIGDKPLRVHRVSVPAQQEKSWSAYTNAVIANDLILLPFFDRDPPQYIAAARAAFQKLMPSHTIKTINMTSMKKLQGELHCLSHHVPAFVPMPDNIYPFANAKKAYFPNQR
ncbi:MAG: agmatine deiminase family protein [Rubripirellula sp.]